MSRSYLFSDGVLWMNDDRFGNLPVIARGIVCPYCCKQHTHGIGDGHRVAHCYSAKTIRSPWGKWMDRNDGYWWMNANVDDIGALFDSLCEVVGERMDTEV